jgi:aryl-alcohol dehydrogenase-like predicted oxidoreductase
MAPLMPSSLQNSLDATKVEYVQLGKSGLSVSLPILGGMSLGSKQWGPWVVDEEESLEILKTAYNSGLNTWDTANMYSNGVSEELLGKAIQKFNIPRQKVVIMTKCFLHVGEEVSVNAAMWGPQLSQSKDYINQAGKSFFLIYQACIDSCRSFSCRHLQRR